MKSDEEVMAELERAAVGLLFMSEADYPFETVYWKGLTEITPQYLRGLTGHAEDAAIKVVGLDDFFRIAISEENRRTPESRLEAKRYRDLLQILKDNLDDVKVYRVGEINIPIYLIGQNRTGNWLGLSTRIVET